MMGATAFYAARHMFGMVREFAHGVGVPAKYAQKTLECVITPHSLVKQLGARRRAPRGRCSAIFVTGSALPRLQSGVPSVILARLKAGDCPVWSSVYGNAEDKGMRAVHESEARQAISVIEKLLAGNDAIIARCDKAKTLAQKLSSPAKREKRTAQLIIMHYSNLTATGGGVSALPGMLPIFGSIFSIFGAGAVDAVLALKFELEMALALSHLAGFDIADPRERKLAFLLVCASLEEAYDTEKEMSLFNIVNLAMGEFSTRELSKSLLKVFARVLTLMIAKKWVKFFPVVGMFVGASVNKVMSAHTGRECWRAFKHRRDAMNQKNGR